MFGIAPNANLSQQDRKQFSEILNYLQQKLPMFRMETAQQEVFRQRLQEIQRRLEDPYFNLAIIGDFSSGKSSFINGIIHQELLKTATLATTAVPTRIRWNAKYYQVEIYLRENRSSSSVELTRLASRWGLNLPAGTAEKIDLVTTNNTLAKKLEEVELRLPVDRRYKNMCLIDTPGVNPGASGAQIHIQQTQNVLRRLADATIVLFPSPSVYTKSFEEFLRENAEHFLNNAIFVVTKMDLVQNSEREGMIRYVQQMLKKQFKLTDPQVYACSSVCALHPERCAAWDHENWTVQFHRLEDIIQGHVQKNRQSIITQGIRTLLKQALELAESALKGNQEQLRKETATFEQNSIENFEVECHKLLQAFETEIAAKQRSQIDSLGALASNAVEAKRSDAKTDIRGCNNRYSKDCFGISYCMENNLPDFVQEAQTQVNTILESKAGELKSRLENYIGQLNRLLQKYNLNISTVQAEMKGIGGHNLQALEDLDMTWKDTTDTFLSDAATIIVGLPVLGVGLLVDAIFDTDLTDFLDGAFTRFMGAFGVDSAKQDAYRKIDSIFDEVKSKSISAAKTNLRAYGKACIQTAGESLDAYVKKYESIFRRAKEQHQFQRERLNCQMSENEAMYKQIVQYSRLIQSK